MKLNVRFGSKADMPLSIRDVRFTPKADIAERNWSPLCAKSRHSALQ
jgi:hypothetical protein